MFLGCLSKEKKGEVRTKKSKLDFKIVFLRQERRSATKTSEIFLMNLAYYTLLSYIFSGSKCTRFIESSQQRVFRGKERLWKFSFLGCFSNAKREECDQRNLALLYLVQLHIFWKQVHAFIESNHQGCPREKI